MKDARLNNFVTETNVTFLDRYEENFKKFKDLRFFEIYLVDVPSLFPSMDVIASYPSKSCQYPNP